MTLKPEEFKKLPKVVGYRLVCLCNQAATISLSRVSFRCPACSRTWLIRNKTAILTGTMRKRRCSILPNWTTSKLGQCKRKMMCESQGRKCSAVEAVTLVLKEVIAK